MRIVLKGEMPDGTCLQLEDWSDSFSHQHYTVGAYPVAKNTGCWGWVKNGERFRLGIDFGDYTEANKAYNALIESKASLADFRENFWNPTRDAFYLGLIDREF